MEHDPSDHPVAVVNVVVVFRPLAATAFRGVDEDEGGGGHCKRCKRHQSRGSNCGLARAPPSIKTIRKFRPSFLCFSAILLCLSAIAAPTPLLRRQLGGGAATAPGLAALRSRSTILRVAKIAKSLSANNKTQGPALTYPTIRG